MLKQISQTPGGVGCSRCRNNKGLPCFSNKGLPCFSNKGLPSPIPKLPRGFAGCVLCSGLVQSLLVAWQDGHTTSVLPAVSGQGTRGYTGRRKSESQGIRLEEKLALRTARLQFFRPMQCLNAPLPSRSRPYLPPHLAHLLAVPTLRLTLLLHALHLHRGGGES